MVEEKKAASTSSNPPSSAQHPASSETGKQAEDQDKKAKEWKERLEIEQKTIGKNPEVPDPYAAVAGPADGLVPHEGVQKDGKVPLPPGHTVNPPGSIPRAPGEWPTGINPPENPLGRRHMGKDRPASEPFAEAELKRTQSKLEDEAAKKGEVPGVVPGSKEEKAIQDKAQAAVDKK